jgi:FkbM family methyltransferase
MNKLQECIEKVSYLERVNGMPTTEVVKCADRVLLEQNGLHGEVVICDVYKIKSLTFVPDVVIDIGANVGFFTRHALNTFPSATVIAVEPDAFNFSILKELTKERAILINAAIGSGEIYRTPNSSNGASEAYLSVMPGFTEENLRLAAQLTDIRCIDFPDLFDLHVPSGTKCMLKIDCEGAENFLFSDAESFARIAKADYVAIELHNYAQDGSLSPEVKALTTATIEKFKDTHDCYQEHVMLYARKR